MATNNPDLDTDTAADCPPDEPSCPDARRPTRTDSGITHTVPNHSIVTVTRHTIIFSEAPSSSSSSSSTAMTTMTTADTMTTPTPLMTDEGGNTPPAPTGGLASSSTGSKGGKGGDGASASVPSGVVVGLVVAGCFVVAVGLLLGFFIFCRRRRRRLLLRHRRRHQQQQQAAVGDGDDNGLGATGEKEQPMSAHTTGTQASGADPFAPFGGRADHTPQVAVEMDGATMAPVELPAEPDSAKSVRPVTPPNHHYKPATAPAAAVVVVDPRANLNSKTESGHGAYVNQWSNWRALGGGAAATAGGE
ncbi:hypothetical protein CP532_3379 [Ophiocordyceps camponoti-leonardi (nom. inval.)]|nr:hypothetical protein CP532_3379 [Ophiocordyceps camponoti-leonardi (nom. inval.)]